MTRKLNPHRRDRGRAVADVPPTPAASEQVPPSRGAFRRWLHRHRWQLVPVDVAAGAYVVAGVAEAWPAGGYTALALAAGGGLALAQRLSDSERLYARAVVAGTSAWVLLADVVGPWTIGSFAVWAAGLLVGGQPWWSSHRVRGRIRVDRLIEAWPDWTTRARMPGVQLISAEAGRVYDRLRLELQRGSQSARQFIDALENYASVRGIPLWRLRADTEVTRKDPGKVDLLITHTDPWRDEHGEPVDLPHPASVDLDAWCAPASICDPIPYGVQAAGPLGLVALRNERGGRLIVVASKKGGGKTVTLHDLLAGLCRMVDADVAVIDCKERGKASLPWAPRLIRRATTPAQALELLAWAEQENGRRGAESPDPILRPTRSKRALVVVCDEYGALVLSEPRVGEYVERLARTIRSASGGLILADQRPDSDTWSGALRGQIDETIVGVMENRRDARAVMGDPPNIDVTEFEFPGQMLQRAGKRGREIEVRSWYLEDAPLISSIVDRCRDRWPDEQVTSNASRSTTADVPAPTPMEQTLELPRGTGAAAMRQQIQAALESISAQDNSGVPDLPAAEMRRRGQATPLPEPTPQERDLDERIFEAIKSSPEGIAMADLERILDEPRSTIQVRAAGLRRQGRVYTHPARGRHARWHVTVSNEREMANA